MIQLVPRSYLTYLLKFGGLFCVFYFGTLLIIGLSSPGNLYSELVDRYLDYVTPLRLSILWSSDQLLRLLGYATVWSDSYTLGISGGTSVRMVYSCAGYGVMSFWAAFVFANQGSAIKKVRWLAAGWALLWTINVLRIFFLLLAINREDASAFPIDHHTLFNVVAYGFIFLLIYFYDRVEKQRISLSRHI